MSLQTEIVKDKSFGIPDPHTVNELSNYMQYLSANARYITANK
uniref:Hypotheticial protein n=1 Tax=Schistosoma japonicum TaxID=6182 RepID=C1LJV2_SCHJA|nr:hypotheticial protein [Schistosoma japonicum]